MLRKSERKKPAKKRLTKNKRAEQATRKLKKIVKEQTRVDKESGHVKADRILCGLLAGLGYKDVVAAYEAVDKWYA